MTRRPEFDALRGLMLVLMTLTHLPTRFSGLAGQPLGFVSAAEGFVLLSAFMAGAVYSELGRRRGLAAMWRAFEVRALKIYLCQAALLLFLFTVIAALGLQVQQRAVTDLISFYLDDPWLALRAALVMFYNPPLLDILPLYVLFMFVSPFVLAQAMRRGWTPWLVVSIALWCLAQFGLDRWAYAMARSLTGLAVPMSQTGAFDPLAWQFMWMLGLALGAGGLQLPRNAQGRVAFPRGVLGAALATAAITLVWRHVQGQVPFPGWHAGNLWFDKWHLGPLRLIDFFALLVLTLHFGPALLARIPRWPALEILGAAALPVFCAHLVMVLLVLALFGPARPDRPGWIDIALLAVTFAVLYGVAWLSARQSAAAGHLWRRGQAADPVPPAPQADGPATVHGVSGSSAR
jgi:hypothetical protein